MKLFPYLFTLILIFIPINLRTESRNVEIEVNSIIREQSKITDLFLEESSEINDSKDINNLIAAIRYVESRNIDTVVNKRTKATGPLQITPICIKDANRLQSERIYKLEDCYDFDTSVEIFHLIAQKYTPDYDFEKLSRRWYGGPKGDNKDVTLGYWKQVQIAYDEIINNDQI